MSNRRSGWVRRAIGSFSSWGHPATVLRNTAFGDVWPREFMTSILRRCDLCQSYSLPAPYLTSKSTQWIPLSHSEVCQAVQVSLASSAKPIWNSILVIRGSPSCCGSREGWALPHVADLTCQCLSFSLHHCERFHPPQKGFVLLHCGAQDRL